MAQKGIIHIIDDEPIIHEVLGELLTSEGYAVELSSNGEEALEKQPDYEFDLILLDLLMPGMNGIAVLKKLTEIDPSAVIIIITAYASVESAIEAMKIGAFDYIQKPFKHDELLLTIERAINLKKLKEENVRLKDELNKKFRFENIIGKSKVMLDVFELIKATAPTRSTILVQGESGTGKELVARAIHQNSDRSHAPFIIINSGSLPPDLIESLLFGHVKGAFTGAISHKKGLFEAADKGTLFLDEISSLNIETQAKLLRVIQDKEFMHLGDTNTIRVDVRIVAATNTDLENLIAEKIFREDLFYRLNVIKIELPPLRERKEDIPLLANHFIQAFSHENNKQIDGISEEVMKVLEKHSWPGNIRELENLIERAVVLTKSPVINRESLPPFLLALKAGNDRTSSSSFGQGSLKEELQTFQRKTIIEALRRSEGIQKKAADILNVKPTTLNEMIKRLKISAIEYSG
ncbi:sigma-54-dependent transcriptional regulator [Acidobacteriota bacterium]